jgi:hypothetical protein
MSGRLGVKDRKWEIVGELCAVVLGVLPNGGSHRFASWDGMPGRLGVKGTRAV